MSELYKKHRPKKLEQVLGQSAATASLQKQIQNQRVPHAILLSGPSGVGKTTIARILRRSLGCGKSDFVEINAADFRGVDTIRDIRRTAGLAPMDGPCRIYLIDECHKMTSEAQDSFLKMLEDNPRYTYFLLATTDPGKLKRTILTRCSEVRLNPLTSASLEEIVKQVAQKESFTLTDTVVEEIVEAADGSARKALVILEQVAELSTEKEQLQAVQASSINKEEAILLARALINPQVNWSEVAGILKNLKDDPEGVRYLILGYFRTVLLGGGRMAPRAYGIIDIFSRNFYDSKHAGLAAACWEVVNILK